MRVGGNQQVVAADRLAGRFQLRADCAVFSVGRNIERQNVDLAQQVFDGLAQPARAALDAAVAQFSRHDDARANTILTRAADAFCYSALRVSDQVGDDVRVQHVESHSTCSGAAGASPISGKSSFRGFIVLSKAISPRLRTGSITRRSPSRCRTASAPGNSNSTGMRTAWLRPLRNSLTWRCSAMGLSPWHMLLTYAISWAIARRAERQIAVSRIPLRSM